MTARVARVLLAICAGLAGASGPAAATAAGLRDATDGWLMPASDLHRLLGGRDRPGPWCELAHGRLHGLAELPLTSAAAGFRLGGARVRLEARHSGATILRETGCAVTVAGGPPWSPRLRLGRAAFEVAGGWSASQLEAAVGLTVPLAGAVACDVDVPLLPAPVWYGHGGLRRLLRLRAGWPLAAVAVAVDRRGDGVPQVQLEVALAPVGAATLGLRAEPASGSLGVTTGWRVGPRLMLRTSHVLHPALGVTHRWGLVAGVPELPS
ncbi:MAG: hypothetical protein R6X25_09840 [Candidatus Krumholzibacteriia bacterium]